MLSFILFLFFLFKLIFMFFYSFPQQLFPFLAAPLFIGSLSFVTSMKIATDWTCCLPDDGKVAKQDFRFEIFAIQRVCKVFSCHCVIICQHQQTLNDQTLGAETLLLCRHQTLYFHFCQSVPPPLLLLSARLM